MDRIDRLACRWDEDERAPPRAIGVTPLKEDPYVPITKILKEFYQEERDRLYCYEQSPTRRRTYEEDHILWHEELSLSSSQDSASSDSESENTKENIPPNVTVEEEVEDDSLVRIVEDSVYKKFSYM